MNQDLHNDVAIVAIGRNEGERLKLCLRSAITQAQIVVYVDSGSTDGSVAFAHSLGCHVVQLDPARPFGPARARNEGFDAALAASPGVAFIQFLDGDCELIDGWLQQGISALHARADVAIVCGNVREVHPEASVYNKLCDLEWQKAPGEILACAGRFIVRPAVFRAVSGFRPDVIAAEDDEFCIRVRRAGWKILQLDVEMARHDAAILRFGQWWLRARRAGLAYAQVAALHGRGQERTFVRDCRSIWLWGLALPVAALALAPFTHGLALLALPCAYAFLFGRIFAYGLQRGWSPRNARIYAWFTTLSKFPGLHGMLIYHKQRLTGARQRITEHYEYK